MPIYEYQCQSCGAEYEDLVRMSTPDEEIPCPECGRHESKKLLSMFASRVRGSTSSNGGGGRCGPTGFS